MEIPLDTKFSKSIKDLLAFDFGNSRVKLFHNNSIISYHYYENWTDEIKKLLDLNPNINTVLISSVNSPMEELLCNFLLKRNEIRIIRSNELLKSQQIIRYDSVENMGADRLFGLIGASIFYKPPFITVDCGTAVTINCLDRDYNVMGGAIFAGLYTQLRSLSLNTDKLKHFKIDDKINSIGTNTKEALSLGLIYSCVGGIKTLVEKFEKENFLQEKVKVILTGGYSNILISYLDNTSKQYEMNKDLILYGIIRSI